MFLTRELKMDEIVKINSLSARYNSFENRHISALKNVDFTVKRGECVGIVGESGCGKSTLAWSMLDLIDKNEGKIIKGNISFQFSDKKIKNFIEITSEEKRKIRGNYISLVFQDPYSSLNPLLKIGAHLKEAYLTHNQNEKDAAGIIKNILMDVELGAETNRLLNSYPHQLSGGMLQRISIAMALINSPELLIADEPTSNLDVTIQKKIVKTLKKLIEKRNLSMIFITHDINLVSLFADTMYILYAGCVVETGASSKLFKTPSHPYTKALLNAIPNLKAIKNGKKINSIPGAVPKSSTLAGCSFFGRCQESRAECFHNKLDLIEVGSGHFVRCIKFLK